MLGTQKTKLLSAIVLGLGVTLFTSLSAATFSGRVPGTNIGVELPEDFEPSGGAWHPRLGQLFVVSDSGLIARMNNNGVGTQTWEAAGNWEGVAVAKPQSNYIYVIDENTARIREFNFATGKLTSRIFKLTAASTAPGVTPLSSVDKDALIDNGDDTGAEALAFVPNSSDPQGGLFYVGSQENGAIYKFRLSLNSGSHVTYLGKIKNWNYKDLAGLEYDWTKKILLAVWDSENKIQAMKADGTLIKEWSVPAGSKDEEGLAYDGASLYIAQDKPRPTPLVKRYDNFVIANSPR